MTVDIAAAGDGMAVIRNLFALYAHDMSEFAGLEVQDDGTFAIPASLATYWEGPEAALRHPFLIRGDSKLAGFALVRQIASGPAVYDMGEFFVLRKHRRGGLGRQAACLLFDRFPGAWQVRQLPSNTPAQAFWRRVIDHYTRGTFTETQELFPAMDREFVVQRFRSDR
jgi:predicted acetyltransferase